MSATPLRAGTVCVADVARSREAYERALEYRTVEIGTVSGSLAESWAAPDVAGAAYALLQPPSSAETWVRLVETEPVAGFEPLVSPGWTALEFCVRDVEAVARRISDSPFEIVGPPRRLDGMESLCAMQVRGMDGEICYFTQIDEDPPGLSLPRAACWVDRLFIHVFGATDLVAAERWLVHHIGCGVGLDRVEMTYTMLARAFRAPLETRFTISTMVRGAETFLQVDQLPGQARPRPRRPGALPPGIAMTTLSVPDLDAVTRAGAAGPAIHDGAVYAGRRSVTLSGPDATLFELLEENA
ncbi:MAG: hypothetical protein F4Y26_08330 [Gammaproteobacteria bacterium]|nr:hypothetical protein [Gammaproteobacteria bacterium]